MTNQLSGTTSLSQTPGAVPKSHPALGPNNWAPQGTLGSHSIALPRKPRAGHSLGESTGPALGHMTPGRHSGNLNPLGAKPSSWGRSIHVLKGQVLDEAADERACPPFRGLYGGRVLCSLLGWLPLKAGPHPPGCCSILSKESQASRAYRFCLLTDRVPDSVVTTAQDRKQGSA